MTSFFIFDEEGEFYDVIKASSLDAAREILDANLKRGHFAYYTCNWRIVSHDELSPDDRLAIMDVIRGNL